MNKKSKKLLSLLIAFICLFIYTAIPINAAAMSAFIDAPSSVAIGSIFTVSVRFESEIEAYLTASLSYDSNNFEFVSCSSSAVNKMDGYFNIVPTEAKTTHKFDFKFKMKNPGPASFSAKVSESYDLNLNSLGTPSASFSVIGYTATQAPVTPKPTVKPTAKPTIKPTTKPTVAPTETVATPTVIPTPSNDMEFVYNNELRYISEDFDENVSIPDGFVKTSYIFKGTSIFVAENVNTIKSDEKIFMVYATDILGKNGAFYVYDKIKDSFILFDPLIINQNEYIFITPPLYFDNSVEALVNIGDYSNLTAYKLPSEEYVDFVVLYGFIPGFAPTYYLYDTLEGSLQRCVSIDLLASNAPTPSESPSPSATPENNISQAPVSSPSETPVSINISSDNSDSGFFANVLNHIKSFARSSYNFARDNIIIAISSIIILAIIVVIIIIVVKCKKNALNNIDAYDEYVSSNDNETVNNEAENDNNNQDIVSTAEENISESYDNADSNESYDETIVSEEEVLDNDTSYITSSSTSPKLNITEILGNDDSDDDLQIKK